MLKSTPQEIRERFDRDVERFSNLQTGQSATIDAPLALELIADAAAAVTPAATHLLDVGCGAGNYALKLLGKFPALHVTLVDLSRPMLERAAERVSAAGAASVTPRQADVRELPLGEAAFDLIVAGATLHHLRETPEWESTFAKFFRALRPGGSIWICDLVAHNHPAVHAMMWKRYGQYLSALKDDHYRDQVFAYVEKEDSPRSLNEQLDLLRQVGFQTFDVLHKNGPFAAFGAVKGT